jgi:hypothetical protein
LALNRAAKALQQQATEADATARRNEKPTNTPEKALGGVGGITKKPPTKGNGRGQRYSGIKTGAIPAETTEVDQGSAGEWSAAPEMDPRDGDGDVEVPEEVRGESKGTWTVASSISGSGTIGNPQTACKSAF